MTIYDIAQKVKFLVEDNRILNLGEIIRYNNRPKIKNENVAEHSFYVASTTLKICKMYNLDNETTLKALQFAIIHDIPELLIGDLPFETKEYNQHLKEEVEKAELNSLAADMPEYFNLYSKFLEEEKHETIPFLVVKLADTISVVQYSMREIELGNGTDSMNSIFERAIGRVTKLILKLETKISEAQK